MSVKSLTYRLTAPILMMGLLVLSLLCGCRHGFDSTLSLADSKMEEHPDSALALLNDYRLTPKSTSADSAYYALLLTHARYKNFIDETNDSLISVSVNYFLDRRDSERASRALFLQGMIRLKARRLGEAAISFRQGLDIAHENEHFMWEGQNAIGMFMVYGNLKNGSEQIKYAKIQYDAFSKGGYEEWKNLANLDILRSYNNNGQYFDALSGTDDLLRIAYLTKDTILIEETLTLIGTCQYSIGNFNDCLESYCRAYELDHTILNNNHKHNISVAYSNINHDLITERIRDFLAEIDPLKTDHMPFQELAELGRFEEAYRSLEKYKNQQDSVIKVIMHNNVYASIGQYEGIIEIEKKFKLRTERIIWVLLSVLILLFFLIFVVFYRHRLYLKTREGERLKSDIEILRQDLSLQISKLDEVQLHNRKISERNETISTYLKDFLFEKYSNIDALCDSYFQDKLIESKRGKLKKEIDIIIRDFSNNDFLKEVGALIDRCFEGIYSSFIEDFPDIKEDTRRLFIFLILRFSARSICVLLDIESSVFYNRKSRLKKLLMECDSKRKDEYLKNLL